MATELTSHCMIPMVSDSEAVRLCTRFLVRWVLVSCVILAFPASAAEYAVVSRVVNGDTIEAGGRDVRLLGIDAPESSHLRGSEATASLKGLILNRRVGLDVPGTDRYDQRIAVVHLEGRNVNRWMVEQDHAWEYDQYSEDTALGRWERKAR